MTSSDRKAGRSEGRALAYERYAPAIRAYAARRVEVDAVDDIVAETFAIAWRRLPAQGDPLPWLYGVARRVVHGHRRSHARRDALIQRLMSRGGDRYSADPAEFVVGDPALGRGFAELSEREREAIRLIAWEGLSNTEAAKVAGCSAATFAVRLSRAKARLAAALDPPPPPPAEPRPIPSTLNVETQA
ncbi:RNA polymerase sigma factor [Solirubrobacter ginsenosidimutans]|uniref:RNA polymerase sigma factor n=1 Tax=Solirubrobacter ginsenosidimutans TaxID=490573 RepID=A0A9X3MM87_9ACTN|nr:RNA polymerase sigma factor [Solirubrobacter ginsenosidimutans]MDA0158814.1 RNA polymerase sigma factor [Solirubrobacter ginsenosidimutans]